MSLAVAIIGKKCGVVASDSIKVSPDGQASFDFDKTFLIQKSPMIVTHVGLLDFSGMNIAEHVQSITKAAKFGSLREAADHIADKLIEKLNVSEIDFEYRKVKLLIISRKKFRSGRYEVRAIDLNPNTNTGQIEYIPNLYHSAGAFAHSGDDMARKYVKENLDSLGAKAQAMRKGQLIQTATDVINGGIERCGKHPRFKHLPACGGPACSKAI